MQINPGLSFTQLSDTHIRIGSGYRALDLTGVQQHILQFLHRLRDGIPDGQETTAAAACELADADCQYLLSKLAPVLVSTPDEDYFVVSSDPDHRGSLAHLRCVTPVFKNGRLHGLAAHDRQAFQMQRRASAVQIFGLGRTGTALTNILVSAGIGHLNVWDSARVTTADLGTGLTDPSIGQVRSLAVATELNPKYKRPSIHPNGWLKRPTFGALATVHITLGSFEPDAIQEAKRRRHPYLPVVVRDDEIDIGPWVVHDGNACPLCLVPAAERAGSDPQSLVTKPPHTGGIETVAGAHLVAGLIANDVLAMVDSQQLRHNVPLTKHGVVPGMNLNTFTRVHLANGWVQTFEVDPRSGCCVALPEPKMASTASP